VSTPSPSLLRRYSQVYPAASAGARLPSILKQRRKAHLAALDSFALFSGVPREPGAENLWIMPALKIFQEPSVIYLTGINQPQVILALVPARKGKTRSAATEILFVPEKNPDREFWDGVRFGYPPGPRAAKSRDVEDVRALTGIADIRPLGEFEAWFESLVKAAVRDGKTHGYAFYHQYDDQGKVRVTKTDHNYAFRQTLEHAAKSAARALKKGFEIRPCAALHYRLRLPLDADQVRDVDKAVAITNEAFKETLRELGHPAKSRVPLRDENALAAHLQYGMLRRSPYGLAFPSIVAGGRNATVLHYLKNDEPLSPRGLVLLDFGARWGTMHADISRTVPVSGKFNPLQALIYGIVLDAAKENQRNARPGETIRNLNDKVWAFLEDALEKRFFSKGGKAERAYQGKPHGVSHLMGEQEHDGDPHRLYQDDALQPGWQISNEPGLYGHFSITLGGKRYAEWIGIRIEDDLLITPRGCRNLSAAIPREISEIEVLMKGRGSGVGRRG
jgi:Xaa-Pro aminopeptidase